MTPPLIRYRVPILHAETGTFVYWFECQAEGEEHALEQAESACLSNETIGEALALGWEN